MHASSATREVVVVSTRPIIVFARGPVCEIEQLRGDLPGLSLIRRYLDQPLAATRYEQNSWNAPLARGVSDADWPIGRGALNLGNRAFTVSSWS